MKCHIANCKTKLTTLQLRLCHSSVQQDFLDSGQQVSSSTTISSEVAPPRTPIMLACLDSKENALKAELIWTLKSVISNYSLNSNGDIVDVLKSMFGSVVSPDMTLSPSKMMYLITEALGPYFWEKTVSDVQKSYYSICYDETTNEGTHKELQIAVRYWSHIESKVVQKHLQTFFMGHAKAEDLHVKILLALEKANLPLRNMLMISCDGPNVNKKLINLFNEKLLEARGKSVIDIGTCTIHKVHNAFLIGLGEMGQDVPDLITSVYHYFDGWPARCEDYRNVQNRVGVPDHRFMKHVSSRWLTVGPAAERVLEQWNALKKYFLNHIPSCSTKQMQNKRYKEIVNFIKEPDMKAQLMFVIESAKVFTTYTKFFQEEGPLVHLLYDQGKELLLKLRGKIYKSEVVRQFSVVEKSLLPLEDICCNEELENELKILKKKGSSLELSFRHGIQKHYLASIAYLIKNLKLDQDDCILKDLRCLQVGNFNFPASIPQIISLGKALPFDVDISELADEWKILKFEENVPTSVSVDEHWSHFFTLKNAANLTKYPTVTKVVKAVLALSHGSASIERGFSISSHVLTSDKAAMTERGINARLNVLSGMNRFKNKASLVPITKELLILARNAHQSYKNYLEEENLKKEICKKEKKRKEFEQTKLKQKTEAAQDLKHLSEDLIAKNKELEKKQTADKLFEEATVRLAKAVKRKNNEELILAQGMFYGVKVLRESEAKVSQEVSSIAKVIQKKTSKISSYFEKKSKG